MLNSFVCAEKEDWFAFDVLQVGYWEHLPKEIYGFLVFKNRISIFGCFVQVLFAERRVQSCSIALIVDIPCVPCRRASADYATFAIQTSSQSSTLLEELVVTHVFSDLDIAAFLAEVKNLS
jgi:hypothetical protein